MAAAVGALHQGTIMQIETIKVMPWGKGQGDFVVINASDFDSKTHKKYTEPPKAKPKAADDAGKTGDAAKADDAAKGDDSAAGGQG